MLSFNKIRKVLNILAVHGDHNEQGKCVRRVVYGCWCRLESQQQNLYGHTVVLVVLGVRVAVKAETFADICSDVMMWLFSPWKSKPGLRFES